MVLIVLGVLCVIAFIFTLNITTRTITEVLVGVLSLVVLGSSAILLIVLGVLEVVRMER